MSSVALSMENGSANSLPKSVRQPTSDNPLTSEEVIDALIVLRKEILSAGFTYDEAMNAMKLKGAAKLLKTVPVDELKCDIIDTVLKTQVIQPTSSGTTVAGNSQALSTSTPRTPSLLLPSSSVPVGNPPPSPLKNLSSPSFGGNQSPSVNPFEDYDTSSEPPVATGVRAMSPLAQYPPPFQAAAVNPFDIEICRRKGKSSGASSEVDDRGKVGARVLSVETSVACSSSDSSGSLGTTPFEDARLKRTHTDPNKNLLKTTSFNKLDTDSSLRQTPLISVGSSSKLVSTPGLEASSSEPSPTSMSLSRTGSYRQGISISVDTGDTGVGLVRTGSYRGHQLVSPELPSPTGPELQVSKGLVRTTSKKGQSLTSLNPSADPNLSLRLLRPGSFNNNGSSLATVREEDDGEISKNPLRCHRVGSFSARLPLDDVLNIPPSGKSSFLLGSDEAAHSSPSLLSVFGTVPTSSIPLAPKSARAEMFHREDSNQTGSGSNPNSNPGSGSVSHSSSLSGAGFDILLKKNGNNEGRSTMEEYEAQQHVVRALQDHAVRPAASDSRNVRYSNTAVEASLRRTPSIEKEDMNALRMQRTPSPNSYHIQTKRLSKTFSDREELISDFTDRVSESGSDMSSPSTTARTAHNGSPSHQHPTSNVHQLPGSLSTDMPPHPPHPEFLARTASKNRDLMTNHDRPPHSNNHSRGTGGNSSLAGKLFSRSSESAVDDQLYVKHQMAPAMALSLDACELASASLDIVGSSRSVEQIMQDPFWDDIDKGSDQTVVPPKSRNPSATPQNLASVVALASQAMSELDAIIDVNTVPSSSLKKVGGQHQEGHRHHHHKLKHASDHEEKNVLDESDEIVSAFKSAIPSNRPPIGPLGRAHNRSPALSNDSAAINLEDYPAIKRKVDDMTAQLRAEGFTSEDIQQTLRSQTLANLKEIKELAYFRILVDSTKSSKKQLEQQHQEHEDKGRPSKSPAPTSTATSSGSGLPIQSATMRNGPARLLSNIRINVRYPEKCVNSTLALQKGCTYMDVLTTVMADVAANVSSPVMYIVDQNGWCREISREGRYSNSCECSLFDLHDGATIEIRELATASVGGRFRLALIADADRNNDSLFHKVRNLTKSYAGYKKIRGDGNCYYRAVVYGALEQIIKERNRQAFRFMYETFKSVLFSNREHNTDHNELLAALAAASGLFRP
jgi:hypothetical protein